MNTAKISGRTVLLSLAALLALSLGVLGLHALSALLPAGEAELAAYARVSAEEVGNILEMEEPRVEHGALLFSGALLRPGKRIGAVRLCVALAGEDAIVLRTKMVRAFELAERYGSDDHVGFAAAVGVGRLPAGEREVLLLDETEGEKRAVETGYFLTVTPEGGVSVRRLQEAHDGE